MKGVTIKISYRITIIFDKFLNSDYLTKELYQLMNIEPLFIEDRPYENRNGLQIYLKENFYISTDIHGIDFINNEFLKRLEMISTEIIKA